LTTVGPAPQRRPSARPRFTALPGLYLVGYPWLSTRGSVILYGAAADAAHRTARTRRRVHRWWQVRVLPLVPANEGTDLAVGT